MKITLIDVRGYYNNFKGDNKTMNFKFDDNSLEKTIDIFHHIGKILNTDLDHYSYDDNNGITYLKTKYLMKHVLEKTKIKQLIQFQMKRLNIIVEYYYKYNLFTITIMKMKIIILKYFYRVVGINFLLIID